MKLNKKGYMLVEIVLASVLAMTIAYYLLNLTYKFNNKSQDIYQSISYTMEKNLITKNIMNDLEQGYISEITKKSDSQYEFVLTLENNTTEIRKLLLENGKIVYGKYDGTNFDKKDVSYYEKQLSKSVIIGDLTHKIDGKVITFRIPIDSIYEEERYDIKLLAKYEGVYIDNELNYKISFVGNGATSGSTEEINCVYGMSYPLKNGFSKTGYTFVGWATSADGEAVYENNANVRNLTTIPGENIVLYAKWKRNFTCESVGSTTTYAGLSWTTIAKDNEYCTLALNKKSNSTGSYNDASTQLTSEYLTSSGTNYNTTMVSEKNAGLLAPVNGSYYIDTNGGTTGTKPSGVYWTDSGKAYDSSSRTQYSCVNVGIFSGIKQLILNYSGTDHTENDILISPSATGCLDKSSSTLAAGERNSTNSTISNSSSTLAIKNGATTQTAISTNNKYSEYVSVHRLDDSITSTDGVTRTASATALPLERKVFRYNTSHYYTSINTFFGAYKYELYPCGGTYHGKLACGLTASSATHFKRYLASSGDTLSLPLERLYVYITAGTATSTISSTTVNGASKTIRTWNYSEATSCKTYYRYQLVNGENISIYYRPRIKIKYT